MKIRIQRIQAKTALRLIWCLSLLAILVINLRQSVNTLRSLSFDQRSNLGQRSAGLEADSSNHLAQSLLLESILSIVQTYYVDEKRTDSADLIDLTLKELGRDPHFKLTNSKESTRLQYGERSVEIPISESYSYNNLVDDAARISRFLSEVWEESAKDVRDISEIKASDDNLWRDKGVSWFLNAMLQGLDPHSALLDPAGYSDLKQGTEGAFGGLGVVVGVRDNLLTVIKPLPGSPAIRAGINKFDRIVKIDNVPTFGTSLDSLVEYMRGEPGTEVKLSLLRDGESYPSIISLKREVIQVSSIESTVINHNKKPYLHVVIESFSSKTASDLENAIARAEHAIRPDRIQGLLLDLRTNPGGLLDQAVAVSDLFLQSGKIVSTIGRQNETEKARDEDSEINLPIIVMISNNTASASEIVAGALQDNNRAIVIGQPSFGKGSVQTIFELPGEQALKLTIARYYTPSGRSIQNVGITPDIWIQPVWQRKRNNNLLGQNRYKNEGFLEHRLTNSIDVNEMSPATLFKGYYLSSQADEDFSVVDTQQNDIELTLGLEIMEAIGRHLPHKDGQGVVPGIERASHTLALAGEEIKRSIDSMTEKTHQWLSTNHSINWKSGSVAQVSTGGIILEPSAGDGLAGKEGELAKIPWRLVNRDTLPAARLSVYLRSNSSIFETQEVLVGMLGPGEEKTGFFEVPVLTDNDEKQLNFSLGFALDAMPVVEREKSIVMTIIPEEERPMLLASLNLTREGGAHEDGVLEANEKAVVEVTIVNTGVGIAKDVVLNIANLSGRQVTIVDEAQTIKAIPRNGSIKAYFPITAGKLLGSNEIEIGLSMKMQNNFMPIHQYGSIPARSNTSHSNYTKVMGH